MLIGSVLVLLLATQTSASDLAYACLGDGSVTATVPDGVVANSVFANNTFQICNTNLTGSNVTIDGCSMDYDIFVIFMQRAESDSIGLLAGESYNAYIIHCQDVPENYTQSFAMTHMPTFTIQDDLLTFTSEFTISSAVRLHSINQPPRYDVHIGSTLYWTIDIPQEYAGIPRTCYALSGSLAPTRSRRDLISDGCSLTGDVESFSHDNAEVIGAIRRYWTTLSAFHFREDRVIRLICRFEFCDSPSGCPINCPERKRREVFGGKDLSVDRLRTDLLQLERQQVLRDNKAVPREELHASGLSIKVWSPEDETLEDVILGFSTASRNGQVFLVTSFCLFLWRLSG